MLSCMGMLKLWRKLPPNTNVSSGVYTAWIHPIVHKTRVARDTLQQRHNVSSYVFFAGLYACVKAQTHHDQPEGIIKVLPCLSSILWQSWHLSPRKMSPCFPDKTQFSYISRFWCVGGISQKTCSMTGKIYCVYTLRLTCTHIYFFSWQHNWKKIFSSHYIKKGTSCTTLYLPYGSWLNLLFISTYELTFPPRRMWYQTEVPPKSMWKSVKQPCTLIRQYLREKGGITKHRF